MVVNQNSLDSYLKVKKENRAEKVYKVIKQYPGRSSKEVADILDWPINSVTPRITDLKKWKLIKVEGTKINENGNKVECLFINNMEVK